MSEDISEVNMKLFRVWGQEVSFRSLMPHHQGKSHDI